MGVAKLLGSFFETAFRVLCRDYSGGCQFAGFFLKLLSNFYVEFYYGGCQFVGVGPCLKMSSDSYVDSILGVANLLGSFLKQRTDCYAETILGVANLQGSVFETAFRLLCRDCSWDCQVAGIFLAAFRLLCRILFWLPNYMNLCHMYLLREGG